jgi:hypothetical protein
VLGGHGHPKRGVKMQLRKMEQTNLQKYGVKYVAQVAEFALKAARNQNMIVGKHNWKTGEKILCQGSYEAAVVDWLNSRSIEFLWQPEVFLVPLKIMKTPAGNQTSYRPDLFLVKEKKWVEIKGYFREDAIKKWAWFCSVNRTAELWDFRRMREMQIL